ncbi:hypothetical protein CSQ89_19280 [Chitinimonas sp. BJB300]|nr:hypothetical protein CSQ89_19280 [Chitinimonas sp. BJB300]TSJ91633.1 hypothetical protein FG002_000185 [Chitinimonas sp. BJB300]
MLAVLCSLAAFNSHATESVGCHVSYGGETLRLQAGPATLPYQVGVTAIGSYFLFRIVFETEPQALAAIKLYIYADRNEGATPIQQATYPYPLSNQQGHYGFTGLQTVYEPVRDGELQYWCELIPHAINKGAMP